jgi:hypothetical protein
MSGDQQTIQTNTNMITLDAFLVFLAAASLPVAYILLMSRWIEPEDRKAQSSAPGEPTSATNGLYSKAA